MQINRQDFINQFSSLLSRNAKLEDVSAERFEQENIQFFEDPAMDTEFKDYLIKTAEENNGNIPKSHLGEIFDKFIDRFDSTPSTSEARSNVAYNVLPSVMDGLNALQNPFEPDTKVRGR